MDFLRVLSLAFRADSDSPPQFFGESQVSLAANPQTASVKLTSRLHITVLQLKCECHHVVT